MKVDKPKCYILCYGDHDGEHIVMVCDSQYKAEYVMNQIQNMGLHPIPEWSEFHGWEDKAFFRNALLIREERIE